MSGLDLGYSLSGDATGVCMLHKEWSRERERSIYVIDFCFGVVAREKAVNLEGITQIYIVRP